MHKCLSFCRKNENHSLSPENPSGAGRREGDNTMGKYFGTDGFRGEANVNLTADHAYKVGRFLGWYYGERKRQAGDNAPARVVIGKDTRRSSYMFEYSLVGGLVASGITTHLPIIKYFVFAYIGHSQ